LILDESGVEVEIINLLDALGHVVRDRIKQEHSSTPNIDNIFARPG
jgi:hypothetical protein